MATSLTILQYKEILETLKSFQSIDLSQYSFVSLRYNMERIMANNRISNHTDFIKKIKTDKKLNETILSCLFCETISLFRDPALWRTIKTKVFDPLLAKGPIKIWMPDISKASDYYTLLIVLKHYQLLDKARIIISDSSSINLQHSKDGEISRNIIENSKLNLKHFNPDLNIESYTYKVGNVLYLNKDLLTNTLRLKFEFMETKLPYSPNIVLFRNKMIYFNHVRTQKAINHIHKKMSGGGFFITGIKENISNFEISNKFRTHDENEQIYRKLY